MKKLSGACVQAKAMAVLRRQMKHVLFTEPAVIQAGQDVTIYYNPQYTPLNGSEEVYLTVSSSHTLSTTTQSCDDPIGQLAARF